MMRVALIALSVKGAMGQYLHGLGTSLGRQVDLHVFVPNHFEQDVGHAHVHRFATGRQRWKAGVRLINPLAARQVWSAIAATQPGIIHLFNGEGYPWSVWWSKLARDRGVPLVVTVHDPVAHPGNPLEGLNASLRGWTMRNASGVHVHNASFVGLVQKGGFSRERIFVIPHGSFAEQFTIHKTSLVQRERMALFFGRIEKYKGIDVLVEAALHLKGLFKVVIAGPGKISGKLGEIINANEDVFELHNRYLTNAEVAVLFQRASVCVLPYRQASQSSVPLISAAFGVPMVATSVGAFPEDVGLVGGVLVPPEDASALAQGILAAADIKAVYPEGRMFDSLSASYVDMYLRVLGQA